ncbi:MAG: sigma-54-dependent Fis family transcriptional regulator [Proteobacteria bacterium]|nr:sigma-54-dependent Fis family transcriptional regulator [Pseudomonadota bacterium]MCP4921988.1 sigma-54-dependent Fis family transcriptional regulator [Pseudomonadota bacterium]
MPPTPHVLVVDDDRAVRTSLRVNLRKAGYEVHLATSANKALEMLGDVPVDLILTDVAMPGMTGLELLAAVKEKHRDVRVVVMTGYGSVEDAVGAMKSGADDYIIKPVSRDELLVIVEKALAERALLAELRALRVKVQEQYGFENLIGCTPAMVEVYELIETVADTSALVLIQGPTGTGKELISQAIHYRSPRSDKPFVRVNCAALPDGLLESELFGHEKGAFTGAIRQHRGKFEQAHGGTLMLDEIGEIPATTQVKLLRVLESGEFTRVGGSSVTKVDTRVIAATNRDLRAEVDAGNFREDLYYRLNVFSIAVPKLADRKDDIPLLVEHFLKRFAERHGRNPELSADQKLLERLLGYHWPGNVRELQHVIERAVILSRGDTLQGVKLPEAPQGKEPAAEVLPEGMTLQAALLEYERRVLIEALKAAGGVQAQAARDLGISRSNLNYRIGRLDIRVKDIHYE